LSERNEACIAPIGFSPDCLEAFNKCCNQTIAANKPSFIGYYLTFEEIIFS